jgi:hypothetical protein
MSSIHNIYGGLIIELKKIKAISGVDAEATPCFV